MDKAGDRATNSTNEQNSPQVIPKRKPADQDGCLEVIRDKLSCAAV
jgi:hypothetical protein